MVGGGGGGRSGKCGLSLSVGRMSWSRSIPLFFKVFSSSIGTKNTAVGVLGAGLGLAGQQGRSMDNHCAELPYVLWYGESKK